VSFLHGPLFLSSYLYFSGSGANQSVIFVLDEFDLFASHKNQSLLYNLLDISQSSHNPIAVVGLTCRLDVVELLEKRVKSRFSHRQLLLFPHSEFRDYVSLTRSLLSLPHNFKQRQFHREWQQNLEKLLQNSKVLQALRQQFRISADVRSLKTLLLLPVSRLGPAHPQLTPSDFSLSLEVIHRDSLGAVMKGLSVLELCLLVAVRQISELSCGEPFNFEMVYSEYKKFAQRSQSMDVFSHSVALKAFDHLLALELLVPVSEPSVKQSHLREYTPVQLVLGTHQISQAVQDYPNCPTDLRRWATNQPVAS
jgi:origin recognition complex subunit 4